MWQGGQVGHYTPPLRISHLRTTWTVLCAVGCSRPCCHPRGGHLPARGAQPPCGVRGHLVGGGGGGALLMARSACAAFGRCSSARTSWFPCVLLCVLLGLVSLPRVGRLRAQLLCCLRSSRFRALSSSACTGSFFFCWHVPRCWCVAPGGGGEQHVAPCLLLCLSGCPGGVAVRPSHDPPPPKGPKGTRSLCKNGPGSQKALWEHCSLPEETIMAPPKNTPPNQE